MRGFNTENISGAIIASVVPPLTKTIGEAITSLFGVKPILVGPGINTGLNIKIDNHSQLGADFVANTVAASSLYMKPLVIIDMGTATTLTAVNVKGELSGVLILPGVRLSLDALSNSAAELPYISFEKPKDLFGTNTVDAMNSGIIYGSACTLDGLIDRICEKFETEDINVVATGGLAKLITPYMKHSVVYSPDLIFKGLHLIYNMNRKKRFSHRKDT